MNDSLEPNTAPGSRCNGVCIALWAVAGVLVIFVCVWPLLAGMAAANDDVGFVRDSRYDGTLLQGIANSWNKASVFRPLDVVAGRLCNVDTLECRAVMLIQIVGLMTFIAALMAVLRCVMPEHRVAQPLMVIWLMLSPATTVSMWQLDSCSQTWSAACGAWLGLLTWRAIDAARDGRRLWTHVTALSVFTLVTLNIKEMMYGWSFGIGLALLAMMAWMGWKGDRRAMLRCAWLVLPVIVLPMAHLALRLKFSALSQTLAAGDPANDATRYQAALGVNLLQNAWLSLLGLFGNGPLHLIDDADAMLPLRILTLASLVSAFVVLMSAAMLRLLQNRPAGVHRGRRAALLLCAAAGLLSVAITLPMGKVSELYGMGANAASGLLVIAALLTLWNPAKPEDRALCRFIAAGCAAIIAISGLYGLVSRAYHFQLTWLYARQLNRTLIEHQRGLEPAEQPALAFVGQACINGRLHSQYVIPPIQAIGLEGTSAWLAERDPSRAMTLVMFTPMSKPGPRDLLLMCDDLPQRGHW